MYKTFSEICPIIKEEGWYSTDSGNWGEVQFKKCIYYSKKVSIVVGVVIEKDYFHYVGFIETDKHTGNIEYPDGSKCLVDGDIEWSIVEGHFIKYGEQSYERYLKKQRKNGLKEISSVIQEIGEYD